MHAYYATIKGRRRSHPIWIDSEGQAVPTYSWDTLSLVRPGVALPSFLPMVLLPTSSQKAQMRAWCVSKPLLGFLLPCHFNEKVKATHTLCLDKKELRKSVSLRQHQVLHMTFHE